MIRTDDPFMVGDVEVDFMVDENATVARVTLYDFGTINPRPVYATGSAKREPGDKRNETIAKQVALGRAFIDLGNALYQAGWTAAGQ
jgi:hypothetical protein